MKYSKTSEEYLLSNLEWHDSLLQLRKLMKSTELIENNQVGHTSLLFK
jgi:hypothetical protein